MREAVEVQLDPLDSPRRRQKRIAKTIHKIQYWQNSRRKAHRSHRKRVLRRLHRMGISLSRIRCCRHWLL